MASTWHVYVLASASGVLYVGVTRDIVGRVAQHRELQVPGFTQRYRVCRLVYTEASGRATDAFEREKQIKRWRRAKKVALIESMNPDWKDLWEDIAEGYEIPPLRSG